MNHSKCSWLVSGLLLGALIGINGCGGQGREELVKPNVVREILRELPLHASVDEVESRLGPPASQSSEGDEVVLHYNEWHLAFVEDALEERSREVWIGPNQARVGGSELNDAILDLERGMTRHEVESRVGPPTSYEFVFVTTLDQPDEVVARYANWQLVFVDGGLAVRTKY